MSCALQGSILRPILLPIIVSYTKTGTDYNLSEFADNNKVSGAADTFEGRDEIQRDLSRLEELAYMNVMKFISQNASSSAMSCTLLSAIHSINTV